MKDQTAEVIDLDEFRRKRTEERQQAQPWPVTVWMPVWICWMPWGVPMGTGWLMR